MKAPICFEFFGGPRDGEVIAIPPGDKLKPGNTLSIERMWAQNERLVYGDVTYRHDGYIERDGRRMVRLTYIKTELRKMP